MKAHWQYFKSLMRHKRFVFQEALKLGLPLWLAIFHDWSKFLPCEWFPYARFFYGKQRRDKTGYYKPYNTGDNDFDMAWLHHQKVNKHHWQYWILPEDDGGTKIFPMPDLYRREMLADWRGAGRAYGHGDTKEWYLANRGHMQLHPETRAWIETMLGV